jgi:hypothetical protein
LLLLSAILAPPDVIGSNQAAAGVAARLAMIIISYNNICKGH